MAELNGGAGGDAVDRRKTRAEAARERNAEATDPVDDGTTTEEAKPDGDTIQILAADTVELSGGNGLTQDGQTLGSLTGMDLTMGIPLVPPKESTQVPGAAAGKGGTPRLSGINRRNSDEDEDVEGSDHDESCLLYTSDAADD